MRIEEDGILFKEPISIFEVFFGSYYGKVKLKIDNKKITSIFDFDYLTEDQRNRLKAFAKKHKSKLPVTIVERISKL